MTDYSRYEDQVRDIIQTLESSDATPRAIRKLLAQENAELDAKEDKEGLNAVITKVFGQMQAAGEVAVPELKDEDVKDHYDDDEVEQDVVEEETSSKRKRASPKADKKKRKKRKKVEKSDKDDDKPKNTGFHQPLRPSPELRAVLKLGEDELISRPETVKQLWVYIKANDLQNPENRREIKCDALLGPALGLKEGDMVTMFKLNTHLSGALTKTAVPAPVTEEVAELEQEDGQKQQIKDEEEADAEED